MVHIRPAKLSDFARLFAWRNDHDTCAQSFTGAVSFGEHWEWLQAVIKDKKIALFIAQDNGTHVGTGRLDNAEQGVFELSVTVAPPSRGSGYASQIIAALVHQGYTWKAGTKERCVFRARIKPSNVASLRAFADNDFVPASGDVTQVILERPWG